jgi:hypothetical protein
LAFIYFCYFSSYVFVCLYFLSFQWFCYVPLPKYTFWILPLFF